MRTSPHRPARPALALLLALGPVAACGQATAPPAPGSTPAAAPTPVGTTSSTEEPASTELPTTTDEGAGASASAIGHGVRLDATFAIGFPEQPSGPGIRKRPGVTVTYTLTRHPGASTGGDLVAYDVVPDGLGSATLPAGVNPEHAWVYADGDTVRISKQGFPIAPGVSFAAAPTMGARAIPAAAPLEGRAYAVTPPELAVPGEEFTAPRGPLPAGSTSFAFCVQVGERVAGMRQSAVSGQAGSDPGGLLQAPVRAPEGDELVCTTPVSLTLP